MWSLNRQLQCKSVKIYRAQTPQNLALTKISAKRAHPRGGSTQKYLWHPQQSNFLHLCTVFKFWLLLGLHPLLFGVVLSQGCARFLDFMQNFSEHQVLWSLCSVDFHTLTLQLPIQTPHSVAPKLQVFVSSLQNCQNFRKTSTPLGNSGYGSGIKNSEFSSYRMPLQLHLAHCGVNLFFFLNEEILLQLDELDELNKITCAWIGLNCSLTQTQNTF